MYIVGKISKFFSLPVPVKKKRARRAQKENSARVNIILPRKPRKFTSTQAGSAQVGESFKSLLLNFLQACLAQNGGHLVSPSFLL